MITEWNLISGDKSLLILCLTAALLAIGLGVLAYFLLRRKVPRLLVKAEAFRQQGKLGRARKLFGRVLSILETRKKLGEAERRQLREAHQGLARVAEALDDPKLAAVHYVHAFQAGLTAGDLSAGGLQLLSQALAEAGNASEKAIEIYLAYLQSRPAPQSIGQICHILAGVGLFREDASREQKVRAVKIARIVVEADDQQGWAHYSLGVTAVLNGRADLGLTHLLRAGELAKSKQPVFYYWLGQAYRLKEKPEVDEARGAFGLFLESSRGEAEKGKRAVAAFYLGADLIERFPLSWSPGRRPGGTQGAPLEEAVRWLEYARNEGKADGDTFYYLGRALFLLGRESEAATALGQALEAAPDNQVYWYACGMVHLAQGQAREAEPRFCRAVELAPDFQEARLALARLYTREGRWAESQIHCLHLKNLAGADPEILGLLLMSLYRQEKYGEVVSRAAEFRPVAQESGAAAMMIGRCHSLVESFPEAVGWYEMARGLTSQPAATYYLACTLGHLGSYSEALEMLGPLMEGDNPFRPQAYTAKGHLLFKTGNYDEATTAYKTALELDPGASEITYSLGAAAYGQGNLDLAADYFSRCLEVDSRHPGALLGTGLVREAQGDRAGALEYYGRVLELSPTQPIVHERLAILYCQEQKYPQALKHFSRLGDKATESEAGLYYLGLALIHAGELKPALSSWSRLSRSRLQDEGCRLMLAQLQYILGRHNVEMGRYSEALELWQQYLQVDFADDQTRLGLAEIAWRIAAENLYGSRDNLPAAWEALNLARQLDQENPKFRYYEALLDLAAGDQVAARTRIELLLQQSPEDSRLLYHLGLLAALSRDRDLASRSWQAAANIDNGDGYAAKAVLALANDLVGQEEYNRAADMLLQVMGKRPESKTPGASHGQA